MRVCGGHQQVCFGARAGERERGKLGTPRGIFAAHRRARARARRGLILLRFNRLAFPAARHLLGCHPRGILSARSPAEAAHPLPAHVQQRRRGKPEPPPQIPRFGSVVVRATASPRPSAPVAILAAAVLIHIPRISSPQRSKARLIQAIAAFCPVCGACSRTRGGRCFAAGSLCPNGTAVAQRFR